MKFLASLSLKAKIIAGIATTVAVAGTVAAVIIISGAPEAFRLLKIFEMTGTSVVTRADTGAMDAYEGMNLESGDIIEVGDESSMRLSLDGNKYLSLDPKTVLELIAEGTEEDSLTSINLRSGGTLNEITEPLSDNSSYSVNTPKATMAVRGTSFYVSVRVLDDGTYITDLSVFHGNVEVQLIDEEGNPRGEPVVVKPNESVAILTIPAEGNISGAEINGTSYFVLRKSDGSDTFALVGEGESPIMPLNTAIIPDDVLDRLLNTHDNYEIILSDEVLEAILGSNYTDETEVITETSISEETTSESETTTTTTTAAVSETTVPETTTTEETTVIPTETTAVTETTVTDAPATTTAEVTEKTTAKTTNKKKETTTEKTTAKTTKETTVTTTKKEIPVSGTPARTTVPSPPSTTSSETTTEVTTEVTTETTTEVTTTPAYYTFKFISDPGGLEVAPSQTVAYDENIALPDFLDEITVDGITYKYDSIGETTEGPGNVVTVTVKYSTTLFSVYVNDNGETSLVGTYAMNSSFNLPQPGGKANATFQYWSHRGVTSGGVQKERGQYSAGASLVAKYDNAYEFESNSDTNIQFDAVYADNVTVTFICNNIIYKTETTCVGYIYTIPSFDSTAYIAKYTEVHGVAPEDISVNSYNVTGMDRALTIGEQFTVTSDMTNITFTAVINP
ncbi:MAG: FecR domain-containing protein [Oscillospiraceae bacterium]|nr:FecR domain-containing protein [Oscillospiraceae bacterium]